MTKKTSTELTQPAYTEEEQAMIAEGTMQVPDIAALSDTGVSAATENFVFTLQSMLVSKDSVLAVMRVDARTDKAAATLAALRGAIDAFSRLPARRGLVCLRHIFPFFSLQPKRKNPHEGMHG